MSKMEKSATENAETDDQDSSINNTVNNNGSSVEKQGKPSSNQVTALNSVDKESARDENNTTDNEDILEKRKETQKKLAATLALSAEEKAKQMEDGYNALGLKRCGNCPFTTSDEILYSNHSSICIKKQVQKETVPLPQDGQILLSFSDLNYTCKTCDLTWINKAEFYEHVVCHISNDPYVCMTCRQNFGSRVLIEQHARQAHPNGDSRCGLRGIKKGKQFVEELEKNGSLTLFGKITIPKTPRNQASKGQPASITKSLASTSESLISAGTTVLVQTTGNFDNTNPIATTQVHDKQNTSTPVIPKSPVTNEIYPSLNATVLQANDSNKVGSSYPDLRNLASKVRPILQKLQEKITPGTSISIATLAQPAKSIDVGMKTVNAVTSPTFQNKKGTEIPPLFGVVNKETGQLEPATIPSRIQTIVPGQTSQSLLQDRTIKNPQYQVKDITEYTTTPSIVTSTPTSVISSTPVYLIPIGPVVHQRQPNNNLMIGNMPVSNSLPQLNHNALSTNPQNVLLQNSSNTRNEKTGSQVFLTTPLNQNIPQQQVPILIPNQQNQLYLVDQCLTLPQQPPKQPLIPGNVTNPLPVTPQTTNMVYIPSCTLPSATNTTIVTGKTPQNLLNNTNFIEKPMPLTQPISNRNIAGNIKTMVEVTSGTTRMIYTPSIPQKDSPMQGVTPSSQTKSILTTSLKDFSTKSIEANTKPASVSHLSILPVVPTTEPPSYKDTMIGKAREIDDCIQTVSTPGTRYLFRIKPGNGFVCEACRKFTKDECTFRNHIWNHFHFDQKACQSCTPEYVTKRQVGRCVLVNSIVCNLIKRSALEYKKMMSMLSSKEVINISDDEEEKQNEKVKGESGTEVIVLEDDDENNQNGLQIRITSTSTISEEDYNTSGNKQSKALAEITEKEPGDSIDENEAKNDSIGLNSVGVKSDKKTSQNENETRNVSNVEDLKNISNIEDTFHKPPVTESSSIENQHNGKSRVASKANEPIKMTTKGIQQQQHLISQELKIKESDNKSVVDKQHGMVQLHKKKNVEHSHTRDQHTQEENTNNSDAYDVIENQIIAGDRSSAFYMCGYEHCSFASCRSMKYKIHLRENHMSEYNFVCCHCGMKDYYEESHIRHLHSHASAKSFALFSCPVSMCSYKSNLLNYYICHLNAHKVEELNIRCVYCNKTFQTTEKLQRHLKGNILKFVNCSYCSFKFSNRRVVLDHIKNVHRDKIRMVTVTSQIVCLEREINFYNPPPAKATMNQEDDIGKSIESINIPAIIEQVQKESAPKLNNDSVEKEAATKDLPEDKKNPGEDAPPEKLQQIEVKGKKRKLKNAGPKSLMCPQCNYLSYNMSLYIRHVSLHDEEPDRTKRFVCNICPYSNDSYSCFKNHSANHIGRSEIKTFECTLCSFNTNLKSLIMDHLNENHEGAAFYRISTEVVMSTESTCRFCDFKARHADQVNLHEKLAHVDTEDKEQDKEQEASVEAGTSQNQINSPTKVIMKDSTKRLKYHCEYCSLEFKHKAQLFSHIQEGHDDIEGKKFTFYKCKYCSLGSTRKEMIVSHIEKEHKGKDIRILRKIEFVESKSEESKINSSAANDSVTSDNESNIGEEVVIPDGNVFKNQFRCPKCNFSTMIRINAIRHIKEHPNLKPIREKTKDAKKTARKSTSKISSIQDKSPGKSHCSLIQNTVLKENPFTAVKEAVDKLKQSEKPQDTYVLGDDGLHKQLSTCFIPIEKDMKFKCKICKQSIMKKFVLHRHVLEHLDVVFFKCKYCAEGTVEKSLLFGHIQKSHPQQTLLYHQLGRDEVDAVIKERLAKLSLDEKTEKSNKADQVLPIEKIKADNPSPSFAKTKEIPKKNKVIKKTAAKYNCTYPNCKYTSRLSTVMEAHLLYHGVKSKDFKCSVCDYRQTRYETLKHIYRNHKGLTSAKAVKVDDLDVADSASDNSEIKSSRESSVDSITSILSTKDSQFVKNSKGKKIKVESLTVSKTGSVYEMKKIIKCKECGIKKESVSSMYKHFSSSKCKRPPYQCSYCSFQRYTKIEIKRHAKIRHPGRKLDLTPLPLSFKMAKLKIPIKQAFEGADANSQERDENNVEMVDSKFSQSSILSPQFDSKEEVNCGLCSSFRCNSVSKLQYHINTIHNGMLLHCTQCSYKTPLIKHMLNHCTNVHLQKQAKYKTLSERCGHDKSVTEKISEISFPCVKCEMTFTDSNRLRYHYFAHLEYKPNVCVHCGLGFQRLFSLQRHAKEKHPNNPIKYKYVKDIQKETKIDKWVEKTKMKRSELIRVKEENNSPKVGKKRVFESDSDTEHSKKKSKKMTSAVETVLDEVTLDSSKTTPMKYRVCLDEKGQRIFKCCHCSFTAGDNKTLRHHLASHGTRLFKCCYCSFSSKIRSKAYSHCKTVHEDQEVKVLDRKTNRILTEHQSENIETGSNDLGANQTGRILRYRCFICQKRVEGLKGYRKHLQRHPEFSTSRVHFNPQVLLNRVSIKRIPKKRTILENNQMDIEHSSDKVETSPCKRLKGDFDASSSPIWKEIDQSEKVDKDIFKSKPKDTIDLKESNRNGDPERVSCVAENLDSNQLENLNQCDKITPNENKDLSDSDKEQKIETDKVEEACRKEEKCDSLEERNRNPLIESETINTDEFIDDSSAKTHELETACTSVENSQLLCQKDEQKYNQDSEKMQEIEKDLSNKMQEIEKDLNNVENSLLSLKKDKNNENEVKYKQSGNFFESENSKEVTSEGNSFLENSGKNQTKVYDQAQLSFEKETEPQNGDLEANGNKEQNIVSNRELNTNVDEDDDFGFANLLDT